MTPSHTCQTARDRGLTPAQATDTCPRCQALLRAGADMPEETWGHEDRTI